MPKRFDEAELLALIEDDLDEQRAAALRDQLEHDPEMKALIERLRRDRQTLRSIPEPQLPHDFAADLEPLVVRSMLTEPPLGEYRRQMARRRGRGRRWVPLAAAASVAVVILGGVWAAVTSVLSSGRDGLDHTFAAAQREAPAMGMELEANLADADRELEPAEDAAWPPPGSTIHHRQPQPVSVAELLAAARPADAPVASAGRTVVADFALVIFNDDPKVGEQIVATVLASLPKQSAMVRNFSYEEAQRLEEEWHLARAQSPERPEATTADASSASDRDAWRDLLIERAREQARARRDRRVDKTDESGQLHGPPEAAPSFEVQLELSSRGATHTVAVPVSQLNELLARLGAELDQATVFWKLPLEKAPEDGSAIWTSAGDARELLLPLTKRHPDAIVLLPVTIRPR
jgi:hypothetical protein